MEMLTADEIRERFYVLPAACFVRQYLEETSVNDIEAVRKGLQKNLPLHRFKRTGPLPRVKRVIGTLTSLYLETLLDIGSGRGVFLWPMLDAFPELSVTVLDRDHHTLERLTAVSRGGLHRFLPVDADLCGMPFEKGRFDCVTALEVLEHVEKPESGIHEILRVASRAAIFSVPSKADNNPEHLHLVTRDWFEKQLANENVSSVTFGHVLNHLICTVIVRP